MSKPQVLNLQDKLSVKFWFYFLSQFLLEISSHFFLFWVMGTFVQSISGILFLYISVFAQYVH